MKTREDFLNENLRENSIVGYDIGNTGIKHPIRINNSNDIEEISFACDEYDCVYSIEEMNDKTIVSLC